MYNCTNSYTGDVPQEKYRHCSKFIEKTLLDTEFIDIMIDITRFPAQKITAIDGDCAAWSFTLTAAHEKVGKINSRKNKKCIKFTYGFIDNTPDQLLYTLVPPIVLNALTL
jgi:hypothetical protein